MGDEGTEDFPDVTSPWEPDIPNPTEFTDARWSDLKAAWAFPVADTGTPNSERT